MNQSAKSELLALLLTIKQDLEADSVHQAGLCSQLSARYPEWDDPLTDDMDTLANQLMHEWAACANTDWFAPNYPVPSCNAERDNFDMFHYAHYLGQLWDKTTEYGRARWAMLNWMIQQLEGDYV